MKSLQAPLRIDFAPLRLWRAPAEGPDALHLCGRSVRSLWDLFLDELKHEGRSEIIVSDVNIPPMFSIAEAHGYTLQSLPLDPRTGLPRAEDLRALIGPQTAAVLVAQLFGNWSPLDEFRRICDQHGAKLVEDRAQSYLGRDFASSPAPHLSLYSFGMIKRASVGFGALALVPDPVLWSRLRERQAAQPLWPARSASSRLFKASVMDWVSSPPFFTPLMNLARLLSDDPDRIFTSALRGFSAGAGLTPYRFRLGDFSSMLVRRSWGRDAATVYIERAERIREALIPFPRVRRALVGQEAALASYWLLPLPTSRPDAFVNQLRNEGLWAVGEVTSLIAREHPEALGRLCYLPVSLRPSARELHRVFSIAESFLGKDAPLPESV